MYAYYANVASMPDKSGKQYSDSEVLMALRKRIEGMSIRKAASLLGVSGAYMHDVLHERRGISERMGEWLGFDLIPPPERKWLRKAASKKAA